MKKFLKSLVIVYVCIYIFLIILGFDDFSKIEKALISLIMTLVFHIFIGIFALPIYIGIKTGKKSIQLEKLSKEDIIKNKQLYRDILYEVSPAVLAYLDNMTFNYEKTIITSLLYLKQKNYIDILGGNIIKNRYQGEIQLATTERLVLESINNGKVLVDGKKLQDCVLKDAFEQKVIKHSQEMDDKWISRVRNAIITYVSAIILLSFVNIIKIPTNIVNILNVLLPIFIILFPIISIVFFLTRLVSRDNDFTKRTKHGIEINRKIEGLKNYIKKYSLLEFKKSDSINIWEEYLIYSVIFEQNEMIEKEYSKYIEKNN